MKLSRKALLTAVTVAIAIIPSALTLPVLAGVNHSAVAQWSVEVNQVDAGDLSIAPEFKVAIYENLLIELVKTKQFSTVLRSGDRDANGVPRPSRTVAICVSEPIGLAMPRFTAPRRR